MKIAILTNFNEIIPGYSLCSIAVDQAVMLQRYGHEVTLFTSARFNWDRSELPLNWPITVLPTFEFTKLVDYKKKEDLSEEHKEYASRLSERLPQLLEGYDAVLTHDWVFTGWNLPFAEALRLSRDALRNVRFLHWIHSVPNGFQDWWLADIYGPNHRIVYPNATDRAHVAAQFRTREAKVVHIPHIKDLRTFSEFQKETCDFLEDHPEMMSAKIVQVYPASTDRLTAKRLREVILMFSQLKKRGWSVCLVVANQHATGRQRKEDVERYKRIGSRNGLLEDVDLVFTSDFDDGKWEKGVPRRILSELMQLANIFFYPTREESFGLVLLEAILMGGCLPIINKSLRQQLEISGYHGLLVDMGSWEHPLELADEAGYLGYIADLIIARLMDEDSIQARTHFRNNFNMDCIYQTYYEPVLIGSALWT